MLANKEKKYKYEKDYVRDLPLILVEGFPTGIFNVYKKITNEELKSAGMIIYSKNYVIEEWMNNEIIEELIGKIYEENSRGSEFFEKYIDNYKKHLDKYSNIEFLDNINDFKEYIKSLHKALEGFIVFYFTAGNDKTPKKILIKAKEIRDKDTIGDSSGKIIKKSFVKIFPHTKDYEAVISKEDLDNIPDKKTLKERGTGFIFLPNVFVGISSLEEFQLNHPEYELVSTNFNEKNISELKGKSVFKGKAKGNVRILIRKKDIDNLKEGEILVSPMTTPDFVPAMKKAAAIITDEGGITCHAAIVSRELKKPCIVGTKIATQVLKDGDLVEVDAEKGIVRILKGCE
ncbi:MAG: PEP-utilizing enzyme [Nitrosopumilus sp.]